ncbi:unnamed protein product [Hydatigera taeniaeformis]|uniref:Transposase n=1 Tax=Hydatigena taeniaeformis TaxID=6205 RepID=A0A0R3XC97_HYDTA|nr:unnamed protein product [Hydatigera taeniaeformis]
MLADNIRHQQRGYARPSSGILATGRCESGRAKVSLETKNRVRRMGGGKLGSAMQWCERQYELARALNLLLSGGR